MAGNIRGLTIEFRGDTTKLDKALKSVDGELRNTRKSLQDVNKALKFNPNNVELMKQKQTLLKNEIDQTRERLNALRKAQTEYNNAGIDKNSAEYQKLRREIIETESKLKHFSAEAKGLNNVTFTALGKSLQDIGANIQDVGGKVTELGSNLTQKLTLPIVGAFSLAGKGALDFGDSLAKVYTLADDTVIPMDQMQEALISMSNESGKGATELAEAMYQALSASVDTADAVGFVEDATKLAKAGFLDTAGSVDVLTTILNAYQKSADETAYISDVLVQTQNDGKTTVNELAQQMGQVIPTAAAYNVGLENLTSAYALMTKQGINTANSTTYINGMLTELGREGSDVAEILSNETGKTFGQLMEEGYSLGDVLQLLYDDVGGDAEQFANLWGNARAGRGALAIAQLGTEEFNAELDKMYNASGNVSSALETLDTPGAQLRKRLNEVKNAGIELGTQLLPYIQQGIDFAKQLIDRWNGMSEGAKTTILTIGLIIAAIGPLLSIIGTIITVIGTLTTVAGTLGVTIGAIAAPILAIIAAVAAAIAIGVALYKNWDTIKAKAIEIWTAIRTTISEKIEALKLKVQEVFQAIHDKVIQPINDAKEKAVTTVQSLRQSIAEKIEAIRSKVSSTFESIKQKIISPFESAKEKVDSIIQKIKGFFPFNVGKILDLKLPHFSITGSMNPLNWAKDGVPKINVDWYAQGGIFNKPSVIGVGEAGNEAVVPLDKFWKRIDGLTGGNTINMNISVNGAEDPEQYARKLVKQLRLELRSL